MAVRAQTQVKPTRVPAIPTAGRGNGLLQRKCDCGNHSMSGNCYDCAKKKSSLQRKAAHGIESSKAPQIVHEVLRSTGEPLDAATRAFMEPRFDHDFSRVRATSPQKAAGRLEIGQPGDRFEQEADQFSQRVMREPASHAHGGAGPSNRQDLSGIRIHTDVQAAKSARAVNALAYTVGNHLVFGAGQYAPETYAGKQLIAHELAHAVQQVGSQTFIQRACDPTQPPLSARTRPVFFPGERKLRSVFRGATTLNESNSTTPEDAIGLIQQAFVDLGFNLGSTGPNKDGVDKLFGSPTTRAVKAFQTEQAIAGAASGEVDQSTLKCLDEQRAHVEVAPGLKPKVTPADVEVKNKEIGGRDEEIFFDRGSSTLESGTKLKITRLLTRETAPLRGCPVTLEGYVSEDELVEFGPALADDRINAVSAEFDVQAHDSPGPVCKKPVFPLRTPAPLPGKSAGSSDYRAWRKVEVASARKVSTAAVCAPFHTPTGAESKVVKEAVKLAVGWMDIAIGKLTPDNKDGDAALTAYFGGTGRRDALKSKLVTWRDHLKNVVPVKSLFASDCNDKCRTAIASNEGVGSDAEMIVCRSFFEPLTAHPTLNADQNRALIMMHEAGHGSISTIDTAYGHVGMLIEFLADYPDIAEGNTDSYTLMVLCLKGFPGYCAPRQTATATTGMNSAEQTKARRGLSWLQTWLIWAQLATSNLYGDLNDSRRVGVSLDFANAVTFQILARAFDLHRPDRDTPPTFGEQAFASAVLDRLVHMMYASMNWPEFEKDTGSAPKDRWSHGPGRKVFLTDAYFALTTDRARVETLLALILHADARVSIALENNYESYIKDVVKSVGADQPPP